MIVLIFYRKSLQILPKTEQSFFPCESVFMMMELKNTLDSALHFLNPNCLTILSRAAQTIRMNNSIVFLHIHQNSSLQFSFLYFDLVALEGSTFTRKFEILKVSSRNCSSFFCLIQRHVYQYHNVHLLSP